MIKGMKSKLLFILACILLQTGCGCDDKEIDPELRPLLDLYLSYAPNDGNLKELRSLQFGEPRGTDLGNCDHNARKIFGHTLTEEYRITIRRPAEGIEYSWKKTVLHELGHCLHNLPHSSDTGAIMFQGNDFDEEFWERHLIEKLDEMFQ